MFNPRTMRYLILLLFTPILCFSQITLQEILAIDSETTFKRTMIENGFSIKEMDEEFKNKLGYKKELTDTEIHTRFKSPDTLYDGGALFLFTSDFYKKNDIHDEIYDLVKKECEFFEIREDTTGKPFAYYKCPDIDPDPKLIEIIDLMHKNLKDTDKSISLTDIEIGFSKSDSIYIINLPISNFNSEKKIEFLTAAYGLLLKEQKE